MLAFNPLSATAWLTGLGTAGVFLILFAETGLLIGFILPGDSLLFTAGLLASASTTSAVHLPLGWVLVSAVAGALLGAQTGYVLGRRAGPALLARSRSARLRDGAETAERYLARYGYGRAIVLARFVPVVRTVLNPLAGALKVPVQTFTLWQVIGGVLWSVALTLAGYVLGASIPGVDQYLLPAVAVVVVVSLIPLVFELLCARRRFRGRAATPEPTSEPTPEPTPEPTEESTEESTL